MEFQPFTFPDQQYTTLSCCVPNNIGVLETISNNQNNPTTQQNISISLNNVLDFSLHTTNCSQEEDQVWLIHKNNTFELLGTVNVDFLNLGDKTNFFVSPQQSNAPQRITSLQVVINAIKETNTKKLVMDDSLISQKIKGDKNTPSPIQIFPLVSGSPTHTSSLFNIKWSKLFFSNATSGNGKSKDQQGYFRVMISLVACIEGGVFMNLLTSVISPKLIVIGSNPGRFKRTKYNTLNPASTPNNNDTSSNSNINNTPLNVILSHNVNSTTFSEIGHNSIPTLQQQPSFTLSNELQFYDTLTDGILSESVLDEKIYSIPPSPQLTTDFESPLDTSPDNMHYTTHSPSSDNDSFKSNGWHSLDNGAGLFTHGNIGINITAPLEALSVGGNILVTGNLYKPSDKRIKQNFSNTDTKSQLQNIKNLRIYNYERMEVGSNNSSDSIIFIPETGFIAQEVNQVLPSAVKTIGDVNLPNGKVVEDMMVVNDHALLVENIGATQQLGYAIDDIETDLQQNNKLIEKLTDMVDSILVSEKVQDNISKKWRFGHGIFNLGPAWTMTILGFFVPIFWFVGLVYMFSERDMRQRSGVISLFLLSIEASSQIATAWSFRSPTVFFTIYCFFWGNGMLVCLAVVLVKYYQQVRKRKKNNAAVKQECIL